jgi:argininosuccinate synthase
MVADYDAVALYSGGTDSTLAPLLAKESFPGKVLLLMVDLGEAPGAVEQARERAAILGWDFELIDGVADFAQEILAEAIQLHADYWGYPLGTPLGRAFQAHLATNHLADLYSQEPRRRYLIHGCSSRQNTRFRLERSCRSEYDVTPIGPLVTQVLSREEKVELLERAGITTSPSDDIATDENIYCRALEGDALNDLRDPDALGLYRVVADLLDTPDEEEHLTLAFEDGLPVAVNGERLPLHEVVLRCRSVGARHGVGRICVFEDTVPELGYKERSIYESPASVLLHRAHGYIEDAVLTKTERELVRTLRHRWAELVYRGDWYTAGRVEIARNVLTYAPRVSGEVTLKLFKASLRVGDASIPQSLVPKPGALRGAY